MNNFKYDAILYDLDGTLIDSVPLILESLREAYIAVLGSCNRTDEDFKSYIGKPLMSSFQMHDEKTSRVLCDKYLEINTAKLRFDEVELFAGVKEELIKLKELGIKQAVVTSKKREDSMVTIKFKGLDEIFDDYIFLEDTKKHKPEAEPILAASEKLGITDISRVLYVGDALSDRLCALNAGADFALVDWSIMPREEIVDCGKCFIITSMQELSCIINNVDL